MHQLIMSRSAANALICSWNFGNSCGCTSEANGWHMAQAIPVFDSVTFIFFSEAPSPWNRLSPRITCSMNASSNACRVAASCGSLCATAEVPANSAATATMPTFTAVRSFVVFIVVSLSVRPAAVGDARLQDLVPVVAGARVHVRGGEYLLAPHLV